MPNFSPYSSFGYLALIKESTAGDAVTPDTFVGILSESIVPEFAITPVQTIAGERERNVRSIPDKIEIGGDVEFYIEPKTIGHFLRALFGAPTTQVLTAATAFSTCVVGHSNKMINETLDIFVKFIINKAERG